MDSLEDILYKVEDNSHLEEVKFDFQQMQAKQVLTAIQSLKESYRIILTLLYIEGYDQEEICSILNINSGNCRTTISRARESLIKKMKGL